MNKKKHRKGLIMFLLMLSVILSAGTFAYWASYVEGTQSDATSSLTVGSASGVETKFDLTNSLNSGGYLVPTNQLDNSGYGVVDSISLSYDLEWKETVDYSQLEGSIVTGQVSVDHYLLIENDGALLNSREYSNIYNLISVDYDPNNIYEMILNGEKETFNFKVSMREPKNQEEYHLISESTISIVFNYQILDNFIEINDLKETVQEGPYINLVGDNVIYVEVGSEFVDPGVEAVDGQGNEIEDTWYTGNHNIWKVGTYEIKYKAYSSYDNKTITSETRTIIVQDTTGPVITLNGDEEFYVEKGSYYNDWGAWAVDNSTKSVTIEVSGVEDVDIHTEGTFEVTYYSSDPYGNESTKIRYVIVK